MNVPESVMKVIIQANMYEDSGNHRLAEKAYFQAINMTKGNKGLIGTLYVNLGTNAMADERFSNAINFFRKACKLLKNEKGDSFLQRAHAHYNLALLLYRRDDKKASKVANEAMQLYKQYPFSSTTDIADAATLWVCSSAFIDKTVKETLLREAWNQISKVNLPNLNQATALPCLTVLSNVFATEVEDYLKKNGLSSDSLKTQIMLRNFKNYHNTGG